MLSRIKDRLGDFGWWSLLLFLATRSGDLIQAFCGLWLVPHYVPQSELGAVLPLVHIAGVVCVPITILLIPLTKFLNTYATNGEYGKLKRLLQTAFALSLVLTVVMFFVTRYLMPLIFERMRVPEGMLGVLVVSAGLVGAVSPIFTNTLQALKKFKLLVVVNALGAPVRLAALLVTMPIRALSGYLVGQMAPSFVAIAGALFGLRNELGKGVTSKPFWCADGRAMLRYAWPIAVNTVVVSITSGWLALLIRQRLPEMESAAYYMISRLAEIGCYVGLSMAVVMFPLAAEAETKGAASPRLLRNLLMGTVVSAGGLAVFYAVFGRQILDAVPLWRPYAVYAPHLVLLTVSAGLAQIASNFGAFEMAQSRFGWLVWTIPMHLLNGGGLIVLTGYGYFWGILPDGVVDWMASLNAARLDFFLWWFLAVNAVGCVCVVAQLGLRRG